MPFNRIFHFIHFGNSDITAIQRSRIESFRRFNPGFKIKIWRDADFDFSKGPRFVQQCLQVKNYAYLSDYYRLVILYENGGIYCDTDMECFKPIDPILTDGPLLEYEFIARDKPQIGTAIMGFPKGHQFIKDALDLYDEADLFDGKEHINQFVITDLYNTGKYDFFIIPHDMHILYNIQEPGHHFTHHHADKTWQYQNEFVLYYDHNADIKKTIDSLDGKHIIVCDSDDHDELNGLDCLVIKNCGSFDEAIAKAIARSSAQFGYFFLTPGVEYQKGIEYICFIFMECGMTRFNGSNDIYITKGKDRNDIQDLDISLLVIS